MFETQMFEPPMLDRRDLIGDRTLETEPWRPNLAAFHTARGLYTEVLSLLRRRLTLWHGAAIL